METSMKDFIEQGKYLADLYYNYLAFEKSDSDTKIIAMEQVVGQILEELKETNHIYLPFNSSYVLSREIYMKDELGEKMLRWTEKNQKDVDGADELRKHRTKLLSDIPEVADFDSVHSDAVDDVFAAKQPLFVVMIALETENFHSFHAVVAGRFNDGFAVLDGVYGVVVVVVVAYCHDIGADFGHGNTHFLGVKGIGNETDTGALGQLKTTMSQPFYFHIYSVKVIL